MPSGHRAGVTDYALLTALAMVFGSSFLFTNLAVQSLPPFTVVASRITLAAVAIYVALRISGESLPQGSVWRWIFASALFGNAIPFSLISWGQQHVDAGLTAIFMAVMPLTTVVLAHFVTADEKLNRWTFIGVWFGMAGVIVLMGWAALSQLDGESLPQLAILMGAMCYAINALITRQLTHLSKWSMSAGLLLAASVLTVPMALIIDTPWNVRPDGTSVLAVVALAIGPTALATWLILVIIARQGASFLSQINFMVPLFGVLFGVLFLQERLPANAWAALAIILCGVALARRGGRAVRQ